MKNFTKRVQIGTNGNIRMGYPAYIHCVITYENGSLTISGNDGESCGQIVMHHWNVANYSKGWDAVLVHEFRKAWKRWHLNDMRAGTFEQETAIREAILDGKLYEEANYEARCKYLESIGLYEVPMLGLADGKMYEYGSKWLSEDVPEAVLEFLSTLPSGTE